MGDSFEELQLIIEAEAKEAQDEIDKLIKKITQTEQEVMRASKSASGMGDAFSKSLSDVDASGVKNGTKKAESVIKKASKDLAKDLILKFKIEDMDTQNLVRNLTEDIARLNYEYGRHRKITGKPGDYKINAEKLTGSLALLIEKTHNAREEIDREISGIYEDLLTSGKIKIPKNALKEFDWKSLDGMLKQHFSTKKGTAIEAYAEEVKGRLGDIFTDFAKANNWDFSVPENKVKTIIALMQRFRDAQALAKPVDGSLVNETTWQLISDAMKKVFQAGQDSFQTLSEKTDMFSDRVQKAREQLGSLWADYADRGGNFNTIDRVTREIDRLDQKIYKLKNSALKKDAGTTMFDNAVNDAAEASAQIDSLKDKLISFEKANGTNYVLEGKAKNVSDYYEYARQKVHDALASGSDEFDKYIEKAKIKSETESTSIKQIVKSALMEMDKLYHQGYDKSPSLLRGLSENLKISKEDIEANADSLKAVFSDYEVLLDAVNKAIERCSTKMAEFASQAKEASTDVAQIETPVDEVEQKASTLGKTFEFIRKTIAESPANLFASLDLTRPKQSFIQLQDNISQTESLLEKLNKKMEHGFSGHGDRFTGTSTYRTLKADIQAAETSLDDYNKKLAEMGNRTHEINWENIGQRGRNAFEFTKNAVVKVTSAVRRLISTMNSKLANGFKNLTKHAVGLDDVAKKLSKSFLRVSNMLRLMVIRMALRGVISEAKESFKELIAFSDKSADSFNKIRNAIHYLADTLAALVSPILNAGGSFQGLGAFVDTITDKIVGLINKLNQLLSALTGKSTWIKAKKQTKDYAKELTNAGKAAKGALASFDELNNITTNKDSGGNDSGVSGDHFEEVPIDPKWKKIADWLKDMWDKADFTELGALLAEKLATMLDRIPWEKIKAAAAKLGKSLATFLNGIWGSLHLANSLGRTLGEAINTAIEFAYAFVENHSFKDFGRFIGTFISTALRTIDWDKLKKLGTMMGEGIADAFNAFLRTDAIVQIGGAIGNLTRTIVNLAWSAVTNIDWEKFGVRLRQGLNAALNRMLEVDESGKSGFRKLAETISGLIKGLLTTINQILGDKETVDKIGRAITEFFDGLDIGGIIAQAKTLAINIAKGLATVLKAAFASEEFREGLWEIGKVLAAFFAGKALFDLVGGAIKLLATNIGQSFATTIAAHGLIPTLQALGGAIGGLVAPIGLVVAAVAIWIHNWDAIVEAGQLLKERTIEHLTAIKEDWINVVEAVKTYASAKWAEIKQNASTFLEALKIGFSAALEAIKGYFELRFGGIKTFVQTTFEVIKSLFTGGLSAMVNTVKEKALEIYNGIKEKLEAVKKFFDNFATNARTFGQNIMTNLANGITLGGGLVRQAFANAFNNSLVGRAVNFFTGKADGGVYKNGQWKPIEHFAAGGLPDKGQMFVANESGPELVGNIGRSTAVMNNDQIVASVSDGVYRAVVSAMSGAQFGTTVVLEGDAERIFKIVRQEGNDYQRRTGRPVFA